MMMNDAQVQEQTTLMDEFCRVGRHVNKEFRRAQHSKKWKLEET